MNKRGPFPIPTGKDCPMLIRNHTGGFADRFRSDADWFEAIGAQIDAPVWMPAGSMSAVVDTDPDCTVILCQRLTTRS